MRTPPSPTSPSRHPALPVVAALALVAGAVAVSGGAVQALTPQEQATVRWDVGSSGGAVGGVVWTGDPTGTTGRVRSVAAAGVAATVRDDVGRVVVPLPPGRYDVRVHLIDPDSTASGQRVVDVVAEGETERDGLDVFRKVGRLGTFVETFRTTVRDGALDLELRAVTGSTSLAALEVLPYDLDDAAAPPTSAPAPAPTGTPTGTPTGAPTADPTPPTATAPAPTATSASPAAPTTYPPRKPWPSRTATPSPTTPPPTTPPPTTTTAAPMPSAPAPAPSCAGGTVVRVATAAQLAGALAAAGPGTTIEVAPGTYAGRFVLRRSGTTAAPLRVCGPTTAVLDAGSTSSGYGLHLDGVADVQVHGLTVRNAQKGLMVDRSTRVVVSGTVVERIGDEAIHLRANTTDSLVTGTTVRDTGLRTAKYGEGIYVGTAVSNWGSVTGGQPDRSDRNRIERNTISRTTSEAIDVKEGTTGGVVAGNTFDGSSMTAADSWVDIKGNDWQVTDNVGRSAPLDGFQTHEILSGWGQRTVFARNVATVDGPGYGIYVHRPLGTVVRCDNTAAGAVKGLSNLRCT